MGGGGGGGGGKPAYKGGLVGCFYNKGAVMGWSRSIVSIHASPITNAHVVHFSEVTVPKSLNVLVCNFCLALLKPILTRCYTCM